MASWPWPWETAWQKEQRGQYVALFANQARQERLLRELLMIAHGLERKVDKLMALVDDLKASISKLNDETTDIGALIKKLADTKVKNSMTDAEVAEVQAAFGTLSDRLTGLAVDPTVPVPPPSPALQALRQKLP